MSSSGGYFYGTPSQNICWDYYVFCYNNLSTLTLKRRFLLKIIREQMIAQNIFWDFFSPFEIISPAAKCETQPANPPAAAAVVEAQQYQPPPPLTYCGPPGGPFEPNLNFEIGQPPPSNSIQHLESSLELVNKTRIPNIEAVFFNIYWDAFEYNLNYDE